jgi:hypothetical protein
MPAGSVFFLLPALVPFGVALIIAIHERFPNLWGSML